MDDHERREAARASRSTQAQEHRMSGKFVLKKTTSGQYMFNLLAGNNQVILTSETYKEKSSAQAGIASVQTNSGNDDRYERKTSSRDEPYFVLKAANAQVIGKSEMYSSKSAMENGIESVKTNGSTTNVDDQTG